MNVKKFLGYTEFFENWHQEIPEDEDETPDQAEETHAHVIDAVWLVFGQPVDTGDDGVGAGYELVGFGDIEHPCCGEEEQEHTVEGKEK